MLRTVTMVGVKLTGSSWAEIALRGEILTVGAVRRLQGNPIPWSPTKLPNLVLDGRSRLIPNDRVLSQNPRRDLPSG
ncbi:hypothetical protein QFZ70_000338 [Arthrobacter sp. V1I9]|jgi:hypothetical protein|nr:hypothetical protein [Arthrobacter sp. V1I9]